MNTNTTSSNQSSSNKIHHIITDDQQLLFIQKCIKLALENNLVEEERDSLDNPIGELLVGMIDSTVHSENYDEDYTHSFVD